MNSCFWSVFVLMFLLQTLGTNDKNVYGYYSIIKEFQWKRVMILHVDHDTFERVSYICLCVKGGMASCSITHFSIPTSCCRIWIIANMHNNYKKHVPRCWTSHALSVYHMKKIKKRCPKTQQTVVPGTPNLCL